MKKIIDILDAQTLAEAYDDKAKKMLSKMNGLPLTMSLIGHANTAKWRQELRGLSMAVGEFLDRADFFSGVTTTHPCDAQIGHMVVDKVVPPSPQNETATAGGENDAHNNS